MTRIYQAPGRATGLRVLIAGAGAYPNAKAVRPGVPVLDDLTSVAPSVIAFAERLLTNWRPDLAMDLLSVDLLLSDPGQPCGATWPGFNLPGECAEGQALDPPTLDNLDGALQAALAGAEPDEGLLLLFCGHGFTRASRYFMASDFGCGGTPWSRAINLTALELALQQEKPRTQWLFWDCCADIPAEILDVLGDIGTPLIQPRASAISKAVEQYGLLSRFSLPSSVQGQRAFGFPGKKTRFTEMLIEALDGIGATKRPGGIWWVLDQGIVDAMRTYVRRHPEIEDADAYAFVSPSTSEAPDRMRFRRLAAAPTSMLIASSIPRTAIKSAAVHIIRTGTDGPPVFSQVPPGTQALLCVQLSPLVDYDVIATFAGVTRTITCFADLPLADAAEFV